MRFALRSRKSAVNSLRALPDVAASRMSETLEPLLERVGSRAHGAVESARSAADAAADWLGRHGDGLHESQLRAMHETRRYVGSHPLRSLAVVFVAGVLFGRLMR